MKPRATTLALLVLALPVWSQSRKLNPTLAPLAADDGARRMFESVLAPGGEWLVYRADHDLAGAPRLYSVPTDGSGPARALSAGDLRPFSRAFCIDPTGAWVAYQDASTALHLVPIDGGQAPLLIGVGALASRFEFTPDGTGLLFQDDALRLAPVLGGTPLVLASGGESFTVAGEHAVYRVRDTSGGFGVFDDELFSVRLDGSAPPTHLTAGLGAPGSAHEIRAYGLTPDGTGVAFLFRGLINDDLYTAATTGPLNRRKLANNVSAFRLAADSKRVAYQGLTGGSPGSAGLFQKPLAGGPSVRLAGPLPVGWGFPQWELTADGGWVVFRVSNPEAGLFAVPLRGGPTSVLDRGGVQGFVLTPDARHIVFTAVDAPGGPERLYAARLQSAPRTRAVPERARTLRAVRLDGGGFEGSEVFGYAPTPDSSRVVYAARQDSWTTELFVAAVDGVGTPLKLSAPFPEGGDLRDFGYWSGRYVSALHVGAAGGRVVYRADQETDELIEFFSVPLDAGAAPLRLNPLLAPSPPVGWVRSFLLEPDGAHVLYEADGFRAGVNELYRVPLAGGPAVRLNAPLQPDTQVAERRTKLSPDGAWAVFQVEPRVDTLPWRDDTFSVALGSAQEPHRLTAALTDAKALDLTFSADAQTLVFRHANALRSVLLDGSAPSVLHGTCLGLNDHRHLRLTPDDQHILYRDTDPLTQDNGLLGTRLDGSTLPSALSSPHRLLENTHDFDAFLVSAGGRAAFLADTDPGGGVSFQLFGVAPNGSELPVLLNGPLVSGGLVQEFTLAGERAVYRADEEVDGRFELYSVALDGSAPRVELSGSFAGGNAGVLEHLVTPDAARVLYFGRELAHVTTGLYVAPVDGSAPGARLAPANLYTWVVSPDGSTVVYASDHRISGRVELFSIPLDGSRAAVRLSPNLVSAGDVVTHVARALQVTADGRTVVFLADVAADGRVELLGVDIDGLSPALVLNGPLAAGGAVVTNPASIPSFLLTGDGSEVVYRAQEQSLDVELYASPVP